MSSNLDEGLDGDSLPTLELLIDLDPDLPLNDPLNIHAARQRGLTFNPEYGAYVDSSGSVIKDPYNHPFQNE